MPHAYQVEISAGAEADLKSIFRYLAEQASVGQADAMLDAILDKIMTLEMWPERGACPKEIEPLGLREFRQVLVAPWRLIYRIAGSSVIILVIADGRRDMQSLLEQRLLGR